MRTRARVGMLGGLHTFRRDAPGWRGPRAYMRCSAMYRGRSAEACASCSLAAVGLACRRCGRLDVVLQPVGGGVEILQFEDPAMTAPWTHLQTLCRSSGAGRGLDCGA